MLPVQTLLNLKRLAVKNVTGKSVEHYVERCYRHYSTKYFTPLHEAKSIIPIEEVILIYMEDQLEDMSAEEMSDLKRELSTSDQPVFSDKDYTEEDAEISDEEWIAQQTQELEKKAKKKVVSEENLMQQTHDEAQKLMQELRGSLDVLKNLGKE